MTALRRLRPWSEIAVSRGLDPLINRRDALLNGPARLSMSHTFKAVAAFVSP
jgi:hypothetical protein